MEATLSQFLASRWDECSSSDSHKAANATAKRLLFGFEHLLRHYGRSSVAVVGALCLVERVEARASPHHHHELLASACSARNTIIACFGLAMKSMEDTPLQLSHLASVLQVDARPLCGLEARLLELLDFRVLVTEQEFRVQSARLAQVQHMAQLHGRPPAPCPGRLLTIEQAAGAWLTVPHRPGQSAVPAGPRQGKLVALRRMVRGCRFACTRQLSG